VSYPLQPSWALISHAAHAGCMRYIIAAKNGWRELDGEKERKWDAHINGAIAESLLAWHFGEYWEPVRERNGAHVIDRSRPDVGRREVRSTAARPGHLLMHRRDRDDVPFWLVRGSLDGLRPGQRPRYEIVGSIEGAKGKDEDYWDDKAGNGRPCFWIPAGVIDPYDG